MNVFSTQKSYLLVVDLLSDDYESVETLSLHDSTIEAENIRRELVAAILIDATENGFAKAYKYNLQTESFDEIDGRPESTENIWFYITEKGRGHVEKHWQEEWSLTDD